MTNKRVVNEHIGKINKAYGNKSGSRYNYIATNNDLMNAYLSSKADLNYALRKEIKRDRYIANFAALEKEINKTLTAEASRSAAVLSDLVVNDIENRLNNITQDITGTITAGKSSGTRSAAVGKKIGSLLGNGIVSNVSGILDDMIYPEY